MLVLSSHVHNHSASELGPVVMKAEGRGERQSLGGQVWKPEVANPERKWRSVSATRYRRLPVTAAYGLVASTAYSPLDIQQIRYVNLHVLTYRCI